MKDIRILTGKRTVFSSDRVIEILREKQIYAQKEEVIKIVEEMRMPMQMRMHTKAALSIAGWKQGYVLDVILTAGSSIESLAAKYAAGDDRLRTAVVYAMAESGLEDFEQQVLLQTSAICREEGFEIAACMPNEAADAALLERELYERLDAGRTLGIRKTDEAKRGGGKPIYRRYKLTETASEGQGEEQREYSITLLAEEETTHQAHTISCAKGSSLLQALREQNIMPPSYCGGRGTCGKCRITVKEGSLPVTLEDQKAFTREELRNGHRLACKAVLQNDLTIRIASAKEEFAVPQNDALEGIQPGADNSYQTGDYGIAIDIGTTTLAFALADLKTGQIQNTHTAVNSQRKFGADVISRIYEAEQGRQKQLQQCIREDLWNGVEALLEKNREKVRKLHHIVIAANTVMLHLLRGYSCAGFCRQPFRAVSLKKEEITFAEAFGKPFGHSFQPKVTLLPGISPFVGADITAGLFACGIAKEEQPALFLDLGTNGEMALKIEKQLFVTSTAAGPAFEGGNIKWGMGSIPGAISKVRIRNGAAEIETIRQTPPKGICGTGVIEAAAELWTAGMIDHTGRMAGEYAKQGYPLAQTESGEWIVFTQQDIREVQMAKAAIRAGIEILCMRSGVTHAQIGRVCLAGGFGYFLNIEKMASVGILPRELAEKTTAVGNSSLRGALMHLMEQNSSVMQKMAEEAKEISLAEDKSFSELYLNYMMF